eukprot:scaffold138930_cov34-Prasinocladus_malaysianus.AAC.1
MTYLSISSSCTRTRSATNDWYEARTSFIPVQQFKHYVSSVSTNTGKSSALSVHGGTSTVLVER